MKGRIIVWGVIALALVVLTGYFIIQRQNPYPGMSAYPGTLRALTPEVPIGKNPGPEITNFFDARLFPQNGVVVDTQSMLIYCQGNTRVVRTINSKEDGFPFLIDNETFPTAVIVSPNTAISGGVEDPMMPGTVCQITPKGDNLTLTKVEKDQVPVHAEDNYQLIAGYLVVPEQEAAKLPMIQKIPLVRTSGEKVIADAKQMRNAIFSPYSGKIVADFPISYRKTGFGPGLYHAKRLGNNVVLAGFTSLNAAKRQYIWHTYQAKTKKWQPTQRKLDTEALVRQLPKQFAFATVKQPESGRFVHMWADGSLIIPLTFSATDGTDQLECKSLIKLPQQGEPQLLLWEIGRVQPSSGIKGKQQSSYQVWSYDENNTMTSFTLPSEGEWMRELVYSIDDAHHAIIFQRAGRLWSLTLDK